MLVEFFVVVLERVEFEFVFLEQFDLLFEFADDDLFLVFFHCQRGVNGLF